jgi:hypothetical protein
VKWAFLAILLAGCDALFLAENTVPPVDGSQRDAPDAPDGPAMCPPEYGPNVYLLIDTPMTWADAEAACRSLIGVGGMHSHLATISSAAEALRMPMFTKTHEAWVGLTRLGTPSGIYHWITTEAGAMPWIAGQPDNDGECGSVQSDGSGLADGSCVTTKRAVCECDTYYAQLGRF